MDIGKNPLAIILQAKSDMDNASSASNSFRDAIQSMTEMAGDVLGMAANIAPILLKVLGGVSG